FKVCVTTLGCFQCGFELWISTSGMLELKKQCVTRTILNAEIFLPTQHLVIQVENISFQVCEELSWDFDGDCIKSVDSFWNVPCIPILSKAFIMKGCWILSNAFSASNEMIMCCYISIFISDFIDLDALSLPFGIVAPYIFLREEYCCDVNGFVMTFSFEKQPKRAISPGSMLKCLRFKMLDLYLSQTNTTLENIVCAHSRGKKLDTTILTCLKKVVPIYAIVARLLMKQSLRDPLFIEEEIIRKGYGEREGQCICFYVETFDPSVVEFCAG
ncbi:hypothetical protein STEG23_008391, partial [Scotinomys teguina]